MELHQLRYLVAVAETGSFTAAAERELISQSGVSAQIAKLERELGRPLLDRATRRVRLTDAGAAALPHVRAALAAVDQVRIAVDEVTGLVRGVVRFGMVNGCSIPPLLDALAALRRRHPDVSLTLIEGESDELQREVAGGALDLALVGWSGPVHPDLDSATMIEETLVVVVGPDHRLATRRRLVVADLVAEVVLGLPVGTGVRAAYDRAGGPPVALAASSPETVLGLTRRGVGVAVVSASMVPDDMVAVSLRTPGVSCALGLVWRSRGVASAAGTAALNVLHEYLLVTV